MRSLRRAALLSVLGATVWGVYRLHTLAGELEHEMDMRGVADAVRAQVQPGAAGAVAAAAAARLLVPAAAGSPAARPSSEFADLEALHSEWAFWVVNLERRPDRLACAMQEFNRLGMRVARLQGVDGTLLDLQRLSFVGPEQKGVSKKEGMLGHKGCLYSHLEFLLRSVGRTDCSLPRYLRSIKMDATIGPVSISVVNRTPLRLLAFSLDTEGREQPQPEADLAPHATVSIESYVNAVWRFRALPEAAGAGLPNRLLGEFLVRAPVSLLSVGLSASTDGCGCMRNQVDRSPPVRRFEVHDCPTLAQPSTSPQGTIASETLKGAVMFEDDVVFDDDFVRRFRRASAALPEDWDVLLLNWYCMGAARVGVRCNRTCLPACDGRSLPHPAETFWRSKAVSS